MDNVNSLSNVRDTIYALALNSELELLVLQTEAFYDSRMVWKFRPVPAVIRNAINLEIAKVRLTAK